MGWGAVLCKFRYNTDFYNTDFYVTGWFWKVLNMKLHYFGMEDRYETPTEMQEPSVVTTTQDPQETVATSDNQPQVDDKPSNEQSKKAENNTNAQRRIRNRNHTNRRIAELEAKIRELEGKDDDVSNFRREQLADRIGDMQAMSADEQTDEFVDRATEFFGEDTDKFMQDTYRYAAYVNENEPDLLLYAQREYGPVLLHEWYKRMDNPQLRQQWLQMTRYEKNMVLHKYYTEIQKVITAYNSGNLQKPAAAPTPKSVPVPGGGRQTPSAEPTDDFGIEFARAEARHKRN